MGQHQAPGQRLQKKPQPLVAGGGLDHGLKLSEFAEERYDLLGLRTGQRFAREHDALLIDDTKHDSLFVEVNADVNHECLLMVKSASVPATLTGYPDFKLCTRRLGLLLLHSFRVARLCELPWVRNYQLTLHTSQAGMHQE
jgi:hypothetical protein